MQILKRAKNAEMDIVPVTESESNIKDEVNRRTYKAGYTNREGGPLTTDRIIIKPPTEQYRKNYDKIDWSK